MTDHFSLVHGNLIITFLYSVIAASNVLIAYLQHHYCLVIMNLTPSCSVTCKPESYLNQFFEIHAPYVYAV